MADTELQGTIVLDADTGPAEKDIEGLLDPDIVAGGKAGVTDKKKAGKEEGRRGEGRRARRSRGASGWRRRGWRWVI